MERVDEFCCIDALSTMENVIQLSNGIYKLYQKLFDLWHLLLANKSGTERRHVGLH